MSAGLPPAPHTDSTTNARALRQAAGRVTGEAAGADDGPEQAQSQLERLVGAEPMLCWAATVPTGPPAARQVDGLSIDPPVVAGILIWPVCTSEPPGIRELAVRAAATGRVTRALLPDTVADAADELIAVPASATSRSQAGSSCVLVVGASRCAELERAALIRRLRESWVPSSGVLRASAVVPDSRQITTPTPAALRESPGARALLAEVVLASVAAHGSVASVALTTAEACARLFDGHRVTLGIERRGKVELLAMSGETRADRRRAINRLMLTLMSDVLARGRGLSLPAPAGDSMPACADELLASNRGMPLMASMQTAANGVRLVIVVERSPGACFTANDSVAIEAAIAPTLCLLGQLEAGGQGRLERTLAGMRSALRDLRHGKPSRRLVGLVIVAVLTGLWLFYPLPYRISGRISVEASDRQVLVAPYAGHLLSAGTRAGDTVEAGQVLATLDDRELHLARDKWLSELHKNNTDQARALALRDRVELARLRADAQRLDAELTLVDERRARAVVRAPFDAVVLSGDPTRSLGAPVSAGEVLFEVASGDSRSVQVEIDEQDIALVASGSSIELRMAALPRSVFEATLDERIPVAVVEAGGNVFRVPATLRKVDQTVLSPGMQGVARIDAGSRSLADAWTRPLRQRCLMIAWKLGLIR